MSEIFANIPKIKFEGADSKNPLAFKYYDPDRVIMGKTMREHLPFAMAWWHNLCAAGTDMFGRDTGDKGFGAAEKGTMEHAKAKVDAGFEFMQKLGIEYFCFHDVDLVPEASDIVDTNRRLDEITDYILEKMNETGIKCLWGTANMFSNPRFMNGAGSTNSADVIAFATPMALRLWQGDSTSPAIGSQTRPSKLESANVAASRHISGVPPIISTMALAAIALAAPTSA